MDWQTEGGIWRSRRKFPSQPNTPSALSQVCGFSHHLCPGNSQVERSRPLSNCVLNATCTDPVRSTPDTEASPLLFYEGHLHPPTQKPGRAAEVPSPSLSAVPPAFPCSSCLGCGSICPATSLSPGHPWEPPGEPDAFIPSNQSTQNEGGWDPDARSR